jgi:hypothetical protein
MVGVVEGGLGEVLDAVGARRLAHDGLADVDDLGGLLAEAVDAEDLQRLAVEQDLEHADGVAGDLRAGDGLERRLGDLVGHLGGGQFALGLADGADLRHRVDAGGEFLDQRPVALAVGDVGADEAALVVTGAGQCRRPGDVADRVDVRAARSGSSR